MVVGGTIFIVYGLGRVDVSVDVVVVVVFNVMVVDLVGLGYVIVCLCGLGWFMVFDVNFVVY